MLSVRSCESSRPRLTPSASRTAISRRRAMARARSRLATLAHAMRSTNATAPRSTISDRRTSGETRAEEKGSPGAGIALYVLVLAFNLGMTLWIGEWRLLAAGILVQTCGFLLLYLISMRVARERSRETALRPVPGGR